MTKNTLRQIFISPFHCYKITTAKNRKISLQIYKHLLVFKIVAITERSRNRIKITSQNDWKLYSVFSSHDIQLTFN
jgi:hypothetical protein